MSESDILELLFLVSKYEEFEGGEGIRAILAYVIENTIEDPEDMGSISTLSNLALTAGWSAGASIGSKVGEMVGQAAGHALCDALVGGLCNVVGAGITAVASAGGGFLAGELVGTEGAKATNFLDRKLPFLNKTDTKLTQADDSVRKDAAAELTSDASKVYKKAAKKVKSTWDLFLEQLSKLGAKILMIHDDVCKLKVSHLFFDACCSTRLVLACRLM